MNSIVEAVFQHAAARPNVLCLADAKMSVSYQEASEYISGTAAALAEAGVQRGDCVIVECTQDVLFSICCLSCQLAGAVLVPLERGASADRLCTVLQETDSTLVIGSRCRQYVPEGIQFLSMTDFVTAAPVSASQKFPEPHEIAEILFSTGTTGKTKGIALAHHSVVAVAENIVYGTEMELGDVELITAPASHSHGLRSHYADLLKGIGVVFANGVSFPSVIFSLMDRYHVTCIDIVPSAIRMLLASSQDRLATYCDQLHYIEIGTAPMGEDDKETLRNILPHTRLYNFYGSTEAGRCCVLNFNKNGDLIGSIGKPTHNSHLFIVDEGRNPVKAASREHPGLLAVSGGMMMAGYWKQPQLTDSVLQDGVLYTNDLCFCDENGFFYVTGRNDDVINCGGIKISPNEIESVVLKLDGIDECACVGHPDELAGMVPVLYVTAKGSCTLDVRKLAAQLSGLLDTNKRPRDIIVLEELPRTYNGKLDRKALRTGTGLKTV